MVQDILEPETFPPQRPVFLKVLCMLTFIGSGWGIINSAISYFNADSMSNMMIEVKTKMNKDLEKDRSKNKGSTEFTGKVMEGMATMTTPENIRKSAVWTLLNSVLCLLGALLMWNLRRSGFYIYTIATIISIIVPFVMFGNNFLTTISAGVVGFIGVLFIIFYAMNLKSMTRT